VSQTIRLEQPQLLEIYNVINTLNTNKACGQDNVSSWFSCV